MFAFTFLKLKIVPQLSRNILCSGQYKMTCTESTVWKWLLSADIWVVKPLNSNYFGNNREHAMHKPQLPIPIQSPTTTAYKVNIFLCIQKLLLAVPL